MIVNKKVYSVVLERCVWVFLAVRVMDSFWGWRVDYLQLDLFIILYVCLIQSFADLVLV